MESDKTVYYTFKFLPLVIGLVFIGVPAMAHLVPGSVMFNGEPEPPDVTTTLIFALVGVGSGLISTLIIGKLVLVEINNQSIKIKKGNRVVEVNWIDVETVDLLPTVFPPLYKLRLKNYDGYFLFNTTRWGAQFIVFTWDWSEMGKLIKRKKKELGI